MSYFKMSELVKKLKLTRLQAVELQNHFRDLTAGGETSDKAFDATGGVMRRESGSAAAVIVILLLLLAGGAYYFFYVKDKPAEQDAAQAEQEEVGVEEETAADNSGEPKAHERIRDNYKEKLNKRLENIPE